MKNRIILYLRFFKNLGLLYGAKVILMRWMSHISTREKEVLLKSSRTGDEYLHIRSNTSDLDLVYTFFLDDGEYDFLIKNNEIRKIVDEANCFVDAGANIGLFSRILLNQNPELKGVAIEVEDSNYVMLNKNLSMYSDIKTMNCALWNENGKIKIIERNGGSKISFAVEKSKDGTGIDAVSVADIIKDLTVDIFKIDIEGSEWEVFDENSDLWIDKVKLFIIELHDNIRPGVSERVISRIISHGYSHYIYGEDHIFIK